MTVTLVTRKSKNIEALAEAIVEPEVVDEYVLTAVKLKKRMDALAPLKKKADDLEAQIHKALNDVLAPSATATVPGILYEMQFGAKGKKTELTDVERAFEILEYELFVKLATIKIADMKAYMTPEQIEEITKVTRKNKRRVKIVKL